MSAEKPLFRLTVDDHLMIAHSLQDPFFGPAQRLHGATLAVRASFLRRGLTEHGVVMDIGAAAEMLDAVLEPLRHRNLDEEPVFAGRFTTTEVIAHHIAEQLVEELARRFPEGHGLTAVEVEAEEHPRARAGIRLDL